MVESGPLGGADETWTVIGQVTRAHLVMLRDVAILDDDVAAALLGAVEAVVPRPPSGVTTLAGLVAAFDPRVDALTPPAVVGAGAVGRARPDITATTLRLLMRAALLRLGTSTNRARDGFLALAGDHVFSLMPAFTDGHAVAITTLGHAVGATIAPLARTAPRLRLTYQAINRSPMGAVVLASTGLPIDRERTAALLGFEGPIAHTLDALSAVDELVDVAEVSGAIASILRRFTSDLLAWLRAEPQTFRLGEEWLADEADPAVPAFRPPSGLVRLVAEATRVEAEAVSLAGIARRAPLEPATILIDLLEGPLRRLLEDTARLAERMPDLVGTMEVNRAYLANRAGRDHTTSAELTDFLMAEEGLSPDAARTITAMTVRRAREQGLEASGLTPDLIDASALLVIGRELKVEAESVGRYLAPRRVLERRTATGSPSPAATRSFLEAERARLEEDRRWISTEAARLQDSASTLTRAIAEIVDAAR